jgi:hypothetical protein
MNFKKEKIKRKEKKGTCIIKQPKEFYYYPTCMRIRKHKHNKISPTTS